MYKPMELEKKLEIIYGAIAEVTGITPIGLKSPTRIREIKDVRLMAYYFLNAYTGLSLVKVGKELGGRDHSTVVQGRKKFNAFCANEKKFMDTVSLIECIIIQSGLTKREKKPKIKKEKTVRAKKSYLKRKELIDKINGRIVERPLLIIPQ
jgi:ssDNA-binding Zn-finger/Zn-ribbon topoisomerase 1